MIIVVNLLSNFTLTLVYLKCRLFLHFTDGKTKDFMKHLCELHKKGYDKAAEKIESIVRNPKYICKKCIRVAHTDERLCKPKRFSNHS